MTWEDYIEYFLRLLVFFRHWPHEVQTFNYIHFFAFIIYTLKLNCAVKNAACDSVIKALNINISLSYQLKLTDKIQTTYLKENAHDANAP